MEKEQTKPRNTIAFPAHPDTSNEDLAGMTLRDYFAAKAIQGIISHYGLGAGNNELQAYVIADAMLKQREL